MRNLFEEYGKVIIVIFVVLAILGTLFGAVKLIDVLGAGANVKTELSHSQSEDAVKFISEREKPVINMPNYENLHLFTNQTFKPVSTVSCYDADGEILDVKVKSILFIDGETGTESELIEYYDSLGDTFDIKTVINKAGTLAVTFEAVDTYNVMSVRTISYVVDEASAA